MKFEVVEISAENSGNFYDCYVWVTENVKPTYIDNTTYPEHLYTVDIYDAVCDVYEQEDIPDFITKFESKLKAMGPDVFYFRFTL
jgi:hypothetical protein